MSKSWEITKVWIKVSSSINTFEGVDQKVRLLTWDTWIQQKDEEGWDKAVTMASQGWELVSSVPIISGHEKRVGDSGTGSSFTEGYWLIFKREKKA